MTTTSKPGMTILFATTIVSAVLGSIHAFSVFLVPLEKAFGASRAVVSLTYSLGLIFLTLTVLFGPMVYGRWRPAVIYVIVAIVGAAGALIAGLSPNIWGVWLGYSLAFGVANGLGYGFGLQYAARAMPDRAGWAMGVVTAGYALGAVIAPLFFARALEASGFFAAMAGLAVVVACAAVLAAFIVHAVGMDFETKQGAGQMSALPFSPIAWLWAAYGTGVLAGLMAIGHAAAIAMPAGFPGWWAPAILAVCNLSGSLIAGALADRVAMRLLLSVLPLMTCLSLAALAIMPPQALWLLGIIGFAYGGTIAVYPSAIARWYPGEDGPRAYGRVFTAWGAAGLFGPWIAGQLFDATGSYGLALWIASALALLSVLLAMHIFKRN